MGKVKPIDPITDMTLEQAIDLVKGVAGITTAIMHVNAAIKDTELQQRLTIEGIEWYSHLMQTIPKDMAEEAVSIVFNVPVPETKSKSRTCKGCGVDISNKHPNAKFHNQKCKDQYWNRVNPRGLGLELNDLLEEERAANADDDGSWEAHQCYTVDDEERHMRIHELKRRMKK